jgi:hypothetical protein
MQKINKLLYGIITLWAIFAIFFGFFDLAISKYAIMYKNLEIFDFSDKYGNHFDDALFFVSITILIGSIFNDTKIQRKIGIVMIFYSIIYLQFMVISSNGDYYTEDLFVS